MFNSAKHQKNLVQRRRISSVVVAVLVDDDQVKDVARRWLR
jgi:hypothetical protein